MRSLPDFILRHVLIAVAILGVFSGSTIALEYHTRSAVVAQASLGAVPGSGVGHDSASVEQWKTIALIVMGTLTSLFSPLAIKVGQKLTTDRKLTAAKLELMVAQINQLHRLMDGDTIEKTRLAKEAADDRQQAAVAVAHREGDLALARSETPPGMLQILNSNAEQMRIIQARQDIVIETIGQNAELLKLSIKDREQIHEHQLATDQQIKDLIAMMEQNKCAASPCPLTCAPDPQA